MSDSTVKGKNTAAQKRGAAIYAVSNYTDQITVKKKKDKLLSWQSPRCEYFDTEDEAKAFIQDRAWRAVRSAEKDLKKAQERLKKCEKKFHISLAVLSEQRSTTSANGEA